MIHRVISQDEKTTKLVLHSFTVYRRDYSLLMMTIPFKGTLLFQALPLTLDAKYTFCDKLLVKKV